MFTHQLQLVRWKDRWLGPQQQNVTEAVGDLALQRSDAFFTYQLAVVVDDAQQGVTHVVRGADLADNTARQILLYQALKLPTPHYLHTPLVVGEDGAKLSKQNGAMPLNTSDPLKLLNTAAQTLGLQTQALANTTPLHDWLHAAVLQWAARFGHTDMSDKISA
jgi:glutamyl-Q tRNA(Asp) synthetase